MDIESLERRKIEFEKSVLEIKKEMLDKQAGPSGPAERLTEPFGILKGQVMAETNNLRAQAGGVVQPAAAQ